MGLTNAAKLFIELYGADIARRHGIRATDDELNNLQTSTSLTGIDKLASDFSSFGTKINKGMMAEMQSDPSDTTNDCYTTTAATNLLILEMFDFTSFTTGSFDFGIFLEKTQTMNFEWMEQLSNCGYNKYLIAFDEMTNNIPMLFSSSANLVT